MLEISLIIIIIILDQASKIWAVNQLLPLRTIEIIPNVFHFTYAENTGAAFSILSGKQLFLIVLTAVAMLIMFVYLLRQIKYGVNPVERLGIAMVIAGGVGNLIDRVRLGYVIDFIDVRLINFAIFNVADAFVSIGMVVIVVSILFLDKG